MIEPTVGLRTHVGNRPDCVTLQQGQELLEGVGRVTNRENGWQTVGHVIPPNGGRGLLPALSPN